MFGNCEQLINVNREVLARLEALQTASVPSLPSLPSLRKSDTGGGEGGEGGEGGDGVGEEEGFRVIHAPLIPERRRMEMLTQMEMLGNVRRDYHDAEPVEDIVDPVSEYTH